MGSSRDGKYGIGVSMIIKEIELVNCWKQYDRISFGVEYHGGHTLFLLISLGIFEIWFWRK